MERPVTNRELRGMIVILYHQNTVNKLSNLVLIQHVLSVNNSTCIKRIEELTWESIHQMTRLGEKIDQKIHQIALLSEKIGESNLKIEKNFTQLSSNLEVTNQGLSTLINLLTQQAQMNRK